MKNVKRVLSILLALTLIIGMVAVAANAETTPLTSLSGSVLTYTMEVDSTQDGVLYKDDVLYVEPGTSFTVDFYMQTNYYVGPGGLELILWTSDVFEAVEDGDYKAGAFVNDWFTPNYTNPANVNSFPSNLRTGYTGFYVSRAKNGNQSTAKAPTTPELLYSITYTVSETTAEGTTAKIFMPEGSIYTATNTRYGKIRQSISDSSTVYGTSYSSLYAETVNVPSLDVVIGIPNEIGEIKEVVANNTLIGDTAVISVEVTGSPESLRVTTPSGDKTFARDDATIETTESGETWLIEVLAEAATTACTVYANYGAAGETAGTAFTIEAFEYCDYTALEQAVNNCSELDSAEEYYDPTDLATWKAALKAAQDLLAADKLVKTDENQATINNAAQALVDAYDELYEIYVDTAPISDAIAAYKTPEKAPEFYDSDKYAAWQDALNAAKAGLINYDGKPDTQANREGVAGLASDLKAAFEALEAEYVDTTALQKAVTNYGATEYGEEYYDATEYATYTDALTVAKNALKSLAQAPDTEDNQKSVADFAAALKAAYEELDARFVDTSALEEAVKDYGATDYTAEYYDAAEYAAYTDALTAAKAGVETYAVKADTAENQAAVAALAADLKAAHEALDARFVDVSDLEEAIAESVPAYGAEYYDEAAYAAFQDAVSAGNALVEAYKGAAADTALNSQAVADAASAIRSAFAKLVPEFIDYSALEEAVKNYGTTPEAADAYTEETYNPYAAALERAQDMLDNKNENAPASDTALAAQIAAAASELESTYKALKLVPVNAIVTNVTAKQQYYKVGDTVNFDFLCSVTNVTKLQIVYANGSTVTYHRGHSAVTVVDNGDGTETWTIAMKIYYDEATATAKAKLGHVWEENGYKFDIKTSSNEDFSVKSAEVLLGDEVVTEFSTEDTVVIKIVCGPNTLRMRLVDQANGATSTYGRTKATQDENGNWVWLITRKAGAGAYAYDIYTTGKTNRLTDEGTDLTYTVKAPVVVIGPSTGDDKDIVVSATAKARLLRDSVQTFTIVTDKNALGVRIKDQYGIVQTYTKDPTTATDNGDGTLTWVITTTCTRADTYTCEVEALYGPSWMSNGTTLTYKVVY